VPIVGSVSLTVSQKLPEKHSRTIKNYQGFVQPPDFALRDQDFMTRPRLVKLNFALHGPAPDGALMPPQYNRRLSDGIISFDNLPDQRRMVERDARHFL
jgi:hypothetical protein